MRNLLFLLGSSSLLILAFATGCRSAEKPPVDFADQLKRSDYSDRVKNIFNYIKDNQFNIPVDQCVNIVILQTNLCNSCNKQKLENILDSLPPADKPFFFILADDRKEAKEQIEKARPGAPVLTDSANLLQKYNLSFMRNLQISICDKRVDNWMFL